MIMYLDFRNEAARVGAVGAAGVEWREAVGRRSELAAVTEAMRAFGWFAGTPPEAVVAAVWPTGAADVSWSTARVAVAVANALGFAWGVPSLAHERTGELGLAELSTVVADLVASSPPSRIEAVYDGAPNVTAAKPVWT